SYFHELHDSLAVGGAVSCYATRISAPAEVPNAIREAMRVIRGGRPRPAYLEMPLDVQSGEANVELPAPEQYRRPAGNPTAIAQAVEALKSAKRPFVFAGGGVESAEATAALARVAELLG